MTFSDQKCLMMFVDIFGTVMCVGEQNYSEIWNKGFWSLYQSQTEYSKKS